MKKAVITGILGQDGSLLAEKLLTEDYEIFGFIRPIDDLSKNSNSLLNKVLKNCEICQVDICNYTKVKDLIAVISPDEIFHLAACHHSSQRGTAFDGALHNLMFQVNSNATINIIHSILELNKTCKMLFAGSSQMYTPGLSPEIIDETVPFLPSTFYGQTKVWGQQMIQFHREKYGLWGGTAILFNHESTRRPNQFISRFITQTAAKIKCGIEKTIEIRNIHALVDFSSARDIVSGMHLMLSSDKPCDYVLASGKLKKVEDILSIAFSHLDLDWQDYIVNSRPRKKSNPSLTGNPAKIKHNLGWQLKNDFQSWIYEMVDYDYGLIHKN